MPEPVSLDYNTPILSANEFEKIRDFAYKTFGLDLRQGKERLVSARLSKHIRKGGFRSFDEYFRCVTADRTGEQLITLIDSLTTNHTSFLREIQHFNFLNNTVFPEYDSAKPMAIWSAASSTGEEPYSLLFSALNARGKTRTGVRLVASDISQRVLAAAKAGIYTKDRVATLPIDWQARFFARVPGPEEKHQVRAAYREKIQFQRINLMDPLPFHEKFHVIFCRNVMIYFDRKTQSLLVNKLAKLLEPGGYLFVGHSESLSGIEHPLHYVMPAVYRNI